MYSHKEALKFIFNKVPLYVYNEYETYKYDGKSYLVHDTVENKFIFIKINDVLYWSPYLKDFHREDGPAYIGENFSKFFIHNKEYAFEEWLDLTSLSEKEKIKLRLQYAK